MTQKVLFLHGLEGRPNGRKGSWLAERYSVVAPVLVTDKDQNENLTQSVDIARKAIEQHEPEIVVGSSFGGAVALKCIQDGVWKGPSVLLAQAGIKYGLPSKVPSTSEIILIHSTEDTIVDHSDSALIARSNNYRVELWSTEGDHRLHNVLEDGTLEKAIRYIVV